jgi:hypothetical protein
MESGVPNAEHEGDQVCSGCSYKSTHDRRDNNPLDASKPGSFSKGLGMRLSP